MKTTEKIRKQLAENPLMLYMKGSPDLPMCGFSSKAAAALKSTAIPFAYVDVLTNPQIMQALRRYQIFRPSPSSSSTVN